MAKQSNAALAAERARIQDEMANFKIDLPDEALEIVRKIDSLIVAHDDKLIELQKAADRIDDQFQVRARDERDRRAYEAEQVRREVAKEIIDHEAIMVEALNRFEEHSKEAMKCLRVSVDALNVQRKGLNDLGTMLGIERGAASGFDEMAFVSRCGQRVAGELSKYRPAAFGPFLNAVTRGIGPESMSLSGWGELERINAATCLELAREVLGDKPND